MIITSSEYLFYEWLILYENLTYEQFKNLTSLELERYYEKYRKWENERQ